MRRHAHSVLRPQPAFALALTLASIGCRAPATSERSASSNASNSGGEQHSSSPVSASAVVSAQPESVAASTSQPAPASNPPTSVEAPIAPTLDDATARTRILAGIHVVSPTERTFTPDSFNGALEHLASLSRTLRVIPNEANGRISGIRLFGIRADDVFAALGFQNGDVLHTIDQVDISTPDRALEAYSRIRNAAVIVVGIERSGAALSLTFRRTP